MIIGREKEQKQLEKLYASEQSEFVALYGRRRVGKTYLIKETFHDHFAFRHTGLQKAPKKVQLKEFATSLRIAGMRNVPKLKDWFDAFNALGELLESQPEGKKVVFIDELPWMDTPKSNIVSALDHFWNSWANYRNDILLIVCGSATSWIIKKIIKNYGGLHNRLTRRIVLPPFTLHECELYATARNLGYTREQMLETYMVLGGIPYYWSLLQRELSWAQNIDELFFAPAAQLDGEFEALYAALFRHPEPHIRIVKILGTKKVGMTRSEIVDVLGEDTGGTLSNVLEELEQCGFIRAYNAIGKAKKDTMFQLIDNYTLFYFQFILENKQGDGAFWSRSFLKPVYNSWSGLAFERVCMQHLPQIKASLGIAGVGANACSWTYRPVVNGERLEVSGEDVNGERLAVSGDDALDAGENKAKQEQGAQIDMLIDRDDQVIDICEMKFSHDRYTIKKGLDEAMRRRRNLFMEKTETRKAVRIVLVTTYGVVDNPYAGNVHNVVTMEDLFKEGE